MHLSLPHSAVLLPRLMDGFRFILENPHPNASNNKHRKRARLVTACDSCRVKKIKCQQPVPNSRCDACKAAKIPCLFGDRDRYQAERGVTCTWSTTVEEIPADLPESSSRKRKMTHAPYPAPPPSLLRSNSQSSSTENSRSVTPAGGFRSNDRYVHSEQRAGPSFTHEINVFPQTAVHAQGNDMKCVSYDQLPLFDPNRPRFPHPYRMRQLGAVFFDRVGPYFPFLDRYDVLHRIEQRTCSAILSNCIAGLAIRFANPLQPDFAASAPFYDMAKSLASHVTSVPSVEALHALNCITWAEYGSGDDDGFWMYSRMAITMCLDLGLGNEATIQVAATPEVRQRLRLTWWMVVCTADIAASWVTGRPAILDLDQYDTRLPEPTDDMSLLLRNIAGLCVLRGRLSRVLDAHVENQGDSSLDWDLSKLQTDLENLSKSLPATMLFNEDNLVAMCDRQMGHCFVQMHILMHALSALLNRPSLLPAYGLPVPADGPRAIAARTSAKSLADTLITVENVAPEALSDPFMDLPILVACRTFIAESDTHAGSAGRSMTSPHSSMLARQWSDTFLGKCKEALVRLSATWGGAATFDNILDRHGGNLADDMQLSASSSLDMFPTPNSSPAWLLPHNFLDDGASDSSGSFRSSSRELSPLLAPSTTNHSKYTTFDVRRSPLVREVDDSGAEMHARELSFYPSEVIMPDSVFSGEGVYTGVSSYLDEQLLMNNGEGHGLCDVDMWRKDSGVADRQSNGFSPVQWLTSTRLRQS
ncbi:fungal-specific transcription factor domain-containing protein [Gautieria morchelliformis]|nr:fungal-specific transcription factor domain-containing protein [Gautieria morchelliformis]